MTDEAGAASVEKSPQDNLDESEDDFVFATEEDVALEPAEPAYAESPPLHNRRNQTPHVSDQWLAQVAVEEPHTPVWRKAQSDWFSVDGASDPEPELTRRANNPAVQHPITAPPVAQYSNDVVEGEPASAEITEPTQTITKESPVDSPPSEVASQAAAPRITPSDVWQTAAIEKSALSAASVAQAPLYTAAIVPSSVEPTSTEDNPVKASQADAAPHSSTAVSDSGTSPFLVADRPGAPFPTNSSATAKPFGQKTVLVVDDSPTVRKLVSITLEKRGYKVVSAFDGVAAIKEIAGHNPSLILMDVNMPRLDGYQLCKLVKKHETTRNIPVLMLTGKDGMFDRLRGRLVGCAGSIAKPFTPEVLIEAVEQQLVQVT
ncbi:MAG: response regulator [Rhodopirellula sp.]|nr:response regulator [Rhodopirellula sp.]